MFIRKTILAFFALTYILPVLTLLISYAIQVVPKIINLTDSFEIAGCLIFGSLLFMLFIAFFGVGFIAMISIVTMMLFGEYRNLLKRESNRLVKKLVRELGVNYENIFL